MKRLNIIAGNWKMNKAFDEANELIDELQEKLEELDTAANTRVIICPPFPYLEMASDIAEESFFGVGAQDVSAEEKGAYTGEVSAMMLESMDIDYCIVGHSERRQYHNESNALIARKVDQLLAHEIVPIVCCGENLADREAGNHFAVVEKQIAEGLFHLDGDSFKGIIIAYEPVWAIGTGRTATPEQAQEMHAFIRGLLQKQYGKEIADSTSILYGGSCKPQNAKELFANPDVDGGLIGGACLNADDFIAIVKAL